MGVRILTGDALSVLRTMPDESVHCAVTSPPYWGLRDYGVAGQLGLETSLGEHIAVLVEVFREVRRVLRSDGTLWLNYGDSYATSVNGRSAADIKTLGTDDRTFRDKPFSTVGPIYQEAHRPSGQSGRRGHSGNLSNGGGGSGERHSTIPDGRIVSGGYLKPKDLCGVPWRVAFALQEDGWWLRQDIIWSKPNPMPESIKDRCTKAHEYIFLLSKSERYHYDIDAIREPMAETSIGRLNQDVANQRGSDRVPGKTNGTMKAVAAKDKRHGRSSDEFRGEPMRNSDLDKFGTTRGKTNESCTHPLGRNKRSVWEVTTQPFSEAHFATFPPALIEPCILAGCPKGGTVLDPFGGAGTTGLVADRLQRNAILIELNPEYAAMARRRIDGDAPLFSREAAE